MLKNDDLVKLQIVKASELSPKEISWLWYPYIPFGKLTLLQGNPGDGKSTLMLAISALLTRGESLPFSEIENNKAMNVIYQTTEDDAEDTIIPRFIAAKGDREKLIFIKEDEKTLTFGDARIKEAINRYDAKLLILDPMSSYLGIDRSLNQANEMRAEFNNLINVAKETGCAIVVVAHMNKMEGINPIYRTVGSIDIAAAVRSILAVVKTADKEKPNQRIMVQIKSNIAPTGSAIVFDVGDSGVAFIDEIEMTAQEAFQSIGPQLGRPSDKCDKAITFLKQLLADGEYHDASECIARLKEAGIKESTFKKAKRILGVETIKPHFNFVWRLAKQEEPEWPLVDDDLPY